MSSVIIRFSNQHLDFTNLSRQDAEGMVETLGEGSPGVTNISLTPNRSFIVNRANIDYVEVQL